MIGSPHGLDCMSPASAPKALRSAIVRKLPHTAPPAVRPCSIVWVQAKAGIGASVGAFSRPWRELHGSSNGPIRESAVPWRDQNIYPGFAWDQPNHSLNSYFVLSLALFGGAGSFSSASNPELICTACQPDEVRECRQAPDQLSLHSVFCFYRDWDE